jgi:hypothetical protein
MKIEKKGSAASILQGKKSSLERPLNKNIDKVKPGLL